MDNSIDDPIDDPMNAPAEHSPLEHNPAEHNPLLLVLSGPSGVGKDLLLARLKAADGRCHFAITATTRPKRAAEQDGIDYIFVSKPQFERMIAQNELLEWATVYGNYYGVPKAQIAAALQRGQDVILKIDIQGAATVRQMAPDAVFIFLAPPDEAELERRLRGRKSESEQSLALRIAQARHEIGEAHKFDHTVIHHTDGTAAAVRRIQDIIRQERRRQPPRQFPL